MKKLLILILMAFSTLANARQYTITWIAPNADIEGDTLLAADVAQITYDVYRLTPTGVELIAQTLPGNTVATVDLTRPKGVAPEVYVVANLYGVSSDPSLTAAGPVIPFAQINAVTGVTITSP